MRSRAKIIDATLDVIARDGFDGVNIASAAAAAGVSRQTVYAIFGTREELVSQAIAGVAVEVLGDIMARLDATESPLEYVVELVVAGRDAVRSHPVLALLLDAERGNPVFDTGMMNRAKPVVVEMFTPMVERFPRTAGALDEIIEIALRLGLSVILFDDDAVHSDDALRTFLARWLGPGLAVIS